MIVELHSLLVAINLLDGAWHSVNNDAGTWMSTDGHSKHPVPQSQMQTKRLRCVELYYILPKSLREGDATAHCSYCIGKNLECG